MESLARVGLRRSSQGDVQEPKIIGFPKTYNSRLFAFSIPGGFKRIKKQLTVIKKKKEGIMIENAVFTLLSGLLILNKLQYVIE